MCVKYSVDFAISIMSYKFIATCVVVVAAILYLFAEIRSDMDSNAPISSSSLADATERLAESIHTTSFLLRQLNNRELNFNECAPIFAAAQKEMQSTVKELKQTVNQMTDDVSRVNGNSFLDQVDGVVTDMPRFVGILEKLKRGGPESDHYTVKFLEQFTQLGTGFAAIASVSKSNNKM